MAFTRDDSRKTLAGAGRGFTEMDAAAGGGGGSGDVSAAAIIADHSIVRGDGGAKGVQGSGVVIDDTDNITGVGLVDGRNLAADGAILDTIEAGATADQTDGEIETGYNNQVSIVSQAEAEAGTATTRRGWTAQRVKQAVVALESPAPTIPKWYRVLRIPNPLAADTFPVLYFPAAATITRIHAERSGGTSVTFNFEERAEGSFFSAGTTVFASDEVLTAAETWTSFNNDSMAANSILTYAASAISGGVTDVVFTLEGTWD